MFFVRVIMAVRMFMMIAVMVFMPVMIISMIVIVGVDVELHPFDAGFLFTGSVQMKIVQVQFGQFALELIERHPQVQQRADEHIAADSAENIQIQSLHFTFAQSAARALIWLAA